MSLFSLDSKFIKVLFKIGNIIQLSLFWFLFSIPIITIGASSSALYYAYNKSVVNNRGYVWNEFWFAFKSNLGQSIIGEIIIAILYIMAIGDFYILRGLSKGDSGLKFDIVLLVIFSAIATAWTVYLFPTIARFKNKTRYILKSSLLMAFFNLNNTVLLVLLFALAVIILVSFPPLVFIVPAAYTACANKILEKIFRKYMSEEDIIAEDNRNRNYMDSNN